MWWSLPLTLVVFFVAKKITLKFKTPLLNPILICMVVIIPILLITNYSYDQYFKGSEVLNWLLQPAIVALAFPLYELLPQIRERWKSILTICFTGSIAAMITGVSIAFWLGATPEIAASVLPKSVTTPIAMAIAGSLEGIPAIAAVCVVIVGMLGSIFGHLFMNRFKIYLPAARGLAMGSVAHALGTARCIEVDHQEGAYSSLALVLCGVITSITAPFLFPLLVWLFN